MGWIEAFGHAMEEEVINMVRYAKNEGIKEKTYQNSKIEQDNSIGLDQEEQVMNGNYGMAQTQEEDQLAGQD